MEHLDGEPLTHVGDLPALGAHRYPDEVAFEQHGETLTYAELDDRARRTANVLLDHGTEPGDRVGLFLPNTLTFPVAYFGAILAGAVPTPLNLRMDPETLAFVLEDAGVDHLVGSAALADETTGLAERTGVEVTMLPGGGEGVVDLDAAVRDAAPDLDRPPRTPDDPACQPYTSGTTGQPKGVVLTHRNLLAAVENLTRAGLSLDPDDSFLLVLPFFHIFALNGIMGPYLTRGATLHLEPEPDPERMLEALDEHSITKFAGVPAMFTEMFRVYREDPAAYDLSALSDAICSGAPLAEAARREIQAAWEIPIYEGWGMTETAPSGTIEPVHGVHKTASCIGPPVPGVEIQLTDPSTRETRVSAREIRLAALGPADLDFEDEADVTGEIAIRGDNVFEGYHNRPEKNAEVFDEDGWFYTRDVARVDEDGYLWIVDRADDMIIAGGENIYPTEVEDALYEHPDVAEAAVVAAPHETKGEAPVAFVVLESGADVTEEELRRFTLDHVATYAHPRRVFFVDELPRSATQKVQRFALEEDARERLGGPLKPSDRL